MKLRGGQLLARLIIIFSRVNWAACAFVQGDAMNPDE